MKIVKLTKTTCPRLSPTRREQRQSRWCLFFYVLCFFCVHTVKMYILGVFLCANTQFGAAPSMAGVKCFIFLTADRPAYPSALTCRRLYTEPDSTTRFYTWPGTNLSTLWLLWRPTRQNLKRTRFVDILHFAYSSPHRGCKMVLFSVSVAFRHDETLKEKESVCFLHL